MSYWIHRLCKPANPAFTMSNIRAARGLRVAKSVLPSFVMLLVQSLKAGGARRDRTDDLMLAKHALSQLSYGPYGLFARIIKWWARNELNVRPHAYQACALTT